jgi:predicted TPR repeat methyltransferase
MVSDNKTLDKVYTAKNHEQLMDAYKDWASEYDADTVDRFGYVAHVASAEALDRVLDSKDAAILDAGCGTGLVGEELVKRATQQWMPSIIQKKCWMRPNGKTSTGTICRPI